MATLGHRAAGLLDFLGPVPGGRTVDSLRGDAQRIVDDAKDFTDLACRSDADGGCGSIPGEVTARAESIERTLRDAAG